jgi:hypothetical protein
VTPFRQGDAVADAHDHRQQDEKCVDPPTGEQRHHAVQVVETDAVDGRAVDTNPGQLEDQHERRGRQQHCPT